MRCDGIGKSHGRLGSRQRHIFLQDLCNTRPGQLMPLAITKDGKIAEFGALEMPFVQIFGYKSGRGGH